MSGHSKWSTIKRAKAVTDSKKSAVFTKLANLITVATREKGIDPDMNFSLRMAIDKAKSANMPKDNIERAIKRGAGELDGAQIEELFYEGFGPAKVQFIVKCLTDNKNRTASNIRHIFTKHGGALGSVMWNFKQKNIIQLSPQKMAGQAIFNNQLSITNLEIELIDAGAEDIIKEDNNIIVYSKVEDLQKLKTFLENKNIKIKSAEIKYIAKEKQSISEEDKEKIEKFIEELEECEDVAEYSHNMKNYEK
ncbi:MAG: YebC/PmpR family DNA-binding transcriptional regulator [Patescibacteria group bacterium]|nr:YebC/PmpR family DNA-binding transcriptional regulator [Patescibacteria group bacterium]